MKRWAPLAFFAVLFGIAAATVLLVVTSPETPPVGTLQLGSFGNSSPKSTAAAPAEFDRRESTGLFVGVRTFPHDPTLTVEFAADDAVELAHKFSLDARSSLVPPRRVVLALSGRPQRPDAEQKLRELLAAGARVEDATAGDILALLKSQVARAGRKGMFVLSLATHGFLDDQGSSYVLGSTSELGSKETSLETASLLDLAGQATRSLVLVDACRDRAGQASRGGAAGPPTVAPHLERMKSIQGQVVLYAAARGQYAYDDPVAGNGVFTKAVLDGLSCEAASRGEVVASRLHAYVDRAVREWMQRNDKGAPGPATQASMDGDTARMPLAQCWRSPLFELRVTHEGSTLHISGEDTSLPRTKDLGRPIVHADAADLDADAVEEVVAGTADGIVVLDRDGNERWREEGAPLRLRTFTIGSLFRTPTSQIVAIWADEDASTSRLTVLDGERKERKAYEHPGVLEHVAVIRATNKHAPRIAAADADSLLVLDPKKLESPVWRRTLATPGERIVALRITDADKDERREITVETTDGKRTLFAVEGRILREGTEWKEARKRKAPTQKRRARAR